MKLFTKNTILLSAILSSVFILNGCTSHPSISDQNTSYKSTSYQKSAQHPYNDNFGLLPSAEVDQIIEETLANSDLPEIDTSMLINDPSLTTELLPDPDAVTLENYVETQPVITYKYMDSPDFYTEDELPENKLLSVN
ncbi:hypothetical protein KKC13_03025 [bacterium]|nr:hypothetical protein [bacterium]MBU1959538.1 hypothetical protein [bacterium]